MWKALISVGKWLVRNPWIFELARLTNEYAIKPIINKLKNNGKRDSDKSSRSKTSDNAG